MADSHLAWIHRRISELHGISAGQQAILGGMALHPMGAEPKGRGRASDQRQRVIPYMRFGGSRLRQGTFLGVADLRFRPAYISVAVRRSTMPRRGVPTREPGRHQRRRLFALPSKHPEAPCATSAHLTCAEILPSTSQNVALTRRSTSVLQPEIVTWLVRGQGLS